MEPLIQIINPIRSIDWDDAMRRWPDATVFHSQGWARALVETYGFTPHYAVCRDAGELNAVMPLMEVREWIRGARAIGLPFSDYCPALAMRAADLHILFHGALDHAERRGWQSIEFRGPLSHDGDRTPDHRYLHHDVDVTGPLENIWDRCRPEVRRAVRKAHQQQVRVRAGIDDDLLAAFWRLQSQTRRRHGLPPQPRTFFRALQQHVMQAGHGAVLVAHRDDRPLAAAIFLRFGDRAIFKYGASDARAQSMRPNDLLMWEGIRWCQAKGLRTLSMGKTHPDHEGLRRFKQGWGARESTIDYYRYDVRAGNYVAGGDPLKRWHHAVFRHLPIPVLQWTGRLLYRFAA